MGHPIFVAARIGNLSELAPNVKTFRDAWAKAGHPGRGAVYLRVPVYVADTDEAAREEPRESILHLLRTIGGQARRVGQRSPAPARSRTAPSAAPRCMSIDYEEVLRERMIVGTPAKVIARLKQLEEQLGLDGILAELNPGSRIPHAQVMTALRLLCEEVIPAFK